MATALDVLVLLFCVLRLKWSNPAGAMAGVAVGATFAFFANRHFAFRDHHPQLVPQAAKFIAATAMAMVVHALVVWCLADRFGIPVVIAKLIADVAVFSVGQLLILRYLVFPRRVPVRRRFTVERLCGSTAPGHSQAERYPPCASACSIKRA